MIGGVWKGFYVSKLYIKMCICTYAYYLISSLYITSKEGAEFAIEKCPVGAEFGGQNINFLMEVFCAIILKLEVICYHKI